MWRREPWGDAAAASGFARRASVDGKGVNALRSQRTEAIIYEAMPGDARQSAEAFADKPNMEVAPLACPSVARVQMAVVADLELVGLQATAQCRFDLGRSESHDRVVHEDRCVGSGSAAGAGTWRLM
jgi:hypothetical protein